ncbi:MAG: EamA family transporter [Bacteroidaceae bacterium]|nr:EamA family transporter [Bacteroidaceae bacterium]
MNKQSLLGHLACFLAYAIFGFNIIVCKDLTAGRLISPLAIFTLRSLGAGVLFWLISLFTATEKVEKKDYVRILGASILGFFVCQVTFLMGIPHITPMDCSVLSAISPIYTMIIAAIVLKEPITLQKAGGVIISFAGIIYLIMSRSSAGGTAETSLFGILMIILNSLSFSLYLGIFKPLIGKYSVVTFMKWIFLFAFVASAPFTAGEIVTLDLSAIPAVRLAELAYLIFCATFITYFLIPVGQKRIRPTLVSMYSYVQPIIAIVISITAGIEKLTWQKVLAAIMVFGGVVVVSYSKSRVEQRSQIAFEKRKPF